MHRLYYIIPIFLIMCLHSAFAIPVNKRQITLVQPDGKEFEAFIEGDEFISTISDSEGHAIIKGSDGFYYYAIYNADGSKYNTGYIVGCPTPSHILSASLNIPHSAFRLIASVKRKKLSEESNRRPGILSRISAETKAGPIKKHCVILLVQFKDKSFKYSKTDFQNLICQKNYSANGATGSVMDYFNDQFKGDYIFEFTLSDIITLSHNCGYYFDDKGIDKDANTHLAVKEACEKANAAGINFSKFDDDKDGEVDNVFLFVAGADQADGGGEDCVWSHQSFLNNTSVSGLTIDGKKINTYAITTELRRESSKKFTIAGIGTFCHEYSHTFGFMDLYDTDYNASGGRANGTWCTTALMDGGNHNNETNTPPNYNAIDYDMLGLGNAEQLKTGSYSLEPIRINRRYLKMETNNTKEYYLIECRDNNGWDRYIGGKGLIIYHIDKSQSATGYSDTYSRVFTANERWEYNEVNCRPSRQCAELIPATPGISAYTNDGYFANNTDKIFYPSASNNAFTSKTNPQFIFWDGSESAFGLTDIKFNGDNIDFSVIKMNDIDLPEVKTNDYQIFQDAAIIQWEATDPLYTGSCFITFGKTDGTHKTEEVFPYEPGKYAITIENLSQRTPYRTKIYFKKSGVTGKMETLNFTTKSMYDVEPYIFLNYVNRNDDGTFPVGSLLPLRVYNIRSTAIVKWFMNDKKIATSGNGFYKVSKSGMLKAEITYIDGSKDIIYKMINVK